MAIATVIAITGEAYARDENGNLRELSVGDTLQEGEVLVTADNARVQLDFGDGLDPTVIGGGQNVVMTPNLDADQPVTAEDASVQDQDLEALLTAIEEGDDDLLDDLAATAAGGGDVGGDGGGHDFVRLARINEDIDPLAYQFTTASLDTVESEDPVAPADELDEIDATAPAVSVVLEDASGEVYSADEIDDGVDASVTLGGSTEVGDTLVVVDGKGNELLNRPVTQDDLDNGVTVTITDLDDTDTVVSVTATVTDPAGNSDSDSDDGVIDTDAPTVTVTYAEDTLAEGESSEVTIDFSEVAYDTSGTDPLTANQLAALLTVDGGSLGTLTQDGTDPTVWTATFTPDEDFDGTGSVTVPNESYADEAGNLGSEGSDTIGLDTDAPTVTVTYAEDTLAEGESSEVTIDFSEVAYDTSGTDPLTANQLAALLTVDGGSLGTLTQDGTDPTVWTATFTPDEDFDGTGSVTVPNESYADEAGNLGSEGSDTIAVFGEIFTSALVFKGNGVYALGDGTYQPDKGDPIEPNDQGTFSVGFGQTEAFGFSISQPVTAITLELTGDLNNVGWAIYDEMGDGIPPADRIPIPQQNDDGTYTFRASSFDSLDEFSVIVLDARQGSSFDVRPLGIEATGTSSDDVIVGTDGNDVLIAGDGDDDLFGGSGDDVLIGGAGDDNLYGGVGADTFVWNLADKGDSNNAASDTVNDFNNGNDILDIADLLKDEELASNTIADYIVAKEGEGMDDDMLLYIKHDGGTDGGVPIESEGDNADQIIKLEGKSFDSWINPDTSQPFTEGEDLIKHLIDTGQINIDQ